jgi:hypothetical protein
MTARRLNIGSATGDLAVSYGIVELRFIYAPGQRTHDAELWIDRRKRGAYLRFG